MEKGAGTFTRFYAANVSNAYCYFQYTHLFRNLFLKTDSGRSYYSS